MDTSKVREDRLRRMAQRQGLQLKKSRQRDPRGLAYGTYGLTDPYRNMWVACDLNGGFGWSLDDIEDWLNADAQERGDLRYR